nr:putative transmembrane protein (PGPGW) [uncultured bacterium]
MLVVLGVVMSIPGVPGQGILTILLGVMLLDFPGKRNFERKLVTRPQVRNAINKLRHRFGKPELVLD